MDISELGKLHEMIGRILGNYQAKCNIDLANLVMTELGAAATVQFIVAHKIALQLPNKLRGPFIPKEGHCARGYGV